MNALAAALVKAQKDMPKVEPDGRANYGSYVTLDHLIAKTRPVLNKHGLAITQFPATSDLGGPVLRTVLIHESGEQLSADTPLFLQKQDMQAFGAAITYARRYGWASVLGIAEQEDDDGAAASRPADAASAPAPSAGASKPAVQPPAAAGTGSQAAAGAQASAAPADDPVTAALHKRIIELAREFGANVVTVQKSIDDNRTKSEGYLSRHHAWCNRQIKTLEENIAAKSSPFAPPAGAMGEAA